MALKRILYQWKAILGLVLLGCVRAIKFGVHEHECLVHEIELSGEFVQMFVEIDRDSSPGPSRHMGVDVVIQAPGGQYIHTEKVKHEVIRNEKASHLAHHTPVISKYDATIKFIALEKGRYNICFHNRGYAMEMVKLEIDCKGEEPLKDAHIGSLMEQMASLSESLVDVEFEQDWLASHTHKRASILRDMSKRVVYKAVLEAFAFMACSGLQVILLQRLLHKHLSGKKL